MVTNTATGSGGAIFSRGSGLVNVINSTVSGNSASGSGGGIFTYGRGSVTNSTISNNTPFG